MRSKTIGNIIFYAVIAVVLFMRAPLIIKHFKFQDQNAPQVVINTLSNGEFRLDAHSKKIIFVFWATWCGPCEVELKRINKMILERKIQPSDILAISSQEELQTIKDKIKKENYLFNVGIDSDGSIAKKFQVTATPTIVFIDEKYVINWMTSGISPTLEFRISSFLK